MSHASHVERTRARVRELQEGMLGMADWARESNATKDDLELLLEPFREMMDELYERDLPLAKLVDDSDLLLHVHGSAVSARVPRVAILSSLLTQTRDQVTRLGKQIAGVTTSRVPKNLEMGLVGIAGGSLFVGFSAAEASAPDADGHGDVTREAIETMARVSALVADDATLQAIAESVPDPAIRDIAVDAVRLLAPSGQVGITEVEVMGRCVQRAVSLTSATRRVARSLMSKPAGKAEKRVEFIGTVRWLDLDAKRFEIRNVEGNEDDVRCAYELPDDEVRELINKRVRVAGTPESGPGRRSVRLLWIEQLETLDGR